MDALERRLLLSGTLPSFVQPSIDASYTLDNSSGTMVMDLNAGSLAVNGDLSTASGWANSTVRLHNSAHIYFNSAQTLGALSVQGNATVTIAQGTSGAAGNLLQLDSLSVASTATLDLGDNAMILYYAPADEAGDLSMVRSLLTSGYNAGAWNGLGINSSSAANDASRDTALGYIDNNDFQYSTFCGINLSAYNQILVRYTFYGDADLDGRLSADDSSCLSSGIDGVGTGWEYGDFNYDGVTNSADVGIFDAELQSLIASGQYTPAFALSVLPIQPNWNTPFSGDIASFTDTVNPNLSASDYVAEVYWGDGSFEIAQVTATSTPGSFRINAQSPLFTAANPVMTVLLQYADGSGYVGEMAVAEEPIDVLQLPPGVNASADAAYSLSGASGNVQLNLTAGSLAFDTNVGSNDSNYFQNLSFTVSGSAHAYFNSPEDFNALNIQNNAIVSVSKGGGGTNGNLLNVQSLSIDPNATLDLSDNGLIESYDSANESAVAAQMNSWLTSGYNGGLWTGPGIDSSVAADDTTRTTGLGWLDNNGADFGTFDGIALNGYNQLLAQYTLDGDADLSGTIDATDVSQFLAGREGVGTGWVFGDSNYDGATDSTDQAMLEANMGRSMNGTTYARAFQPAGIVINPIEGVPFSGDIATFSDLLNPSNTDPSIYEAQVNWGDGSFVAAQVTATDTPGSFRINAVSPALTNPNAVMAVIIGYADMNDPSPTYQGRPAMVSEPITMTAAVSDLIATAASTSEIDLTWTLNAANASAIEVDRSTDGTNWQMLTNSLSGSATSYSDSTGLAEATHYYYRVSPIWTSDASAFTNTADAWTLAVAPSGLAGPDPSAPPSDSAISLSWTDNSSGLAGTTIYISTDGVNFSYFDDVPAGQTTYTAEELDADTTYWFYVTSTTPGGDSLPSNTISSATTSVTAPSNLQVTINSDTDATLQWADNSSDEDGFEIDWSTDGTNFEELDTVGADTTTYDASTLTPGTSYSFRVSAIADAGQSDAVTSSPETTLPPAPTEPSATSSDDSSISLSWDAAASATGYIVQRTDPGGGWQEVGRTADTDFSDTGLSPATSYQYRLAAVNDTGQSSFGDPATALTLPGAPSSLQAQGKPGGEIDLTWTNSSTTADGIRVLMKHGDQDFTAMTTLSATASSYNATNLDPGTTYTFKVVAYNAAGDAESSTTSAQTQTPASGTLTPNDDSWTGPVNIGFEMNFLGKKSDQLYINNNGNVMFDAGSSTYTPSSSIETQYGAIIAPFFADVDTRGLSGGTVSYGPNPGVGGQPGFQVSWDHVDYYNAVAPSHHSLHDTFSLQITDRSDVSPGDFDIDFHYGTIQWDTGDASGGSSGVSNGTTGHPARIGYSNGTGKSGTWDEVSGSGSPGAFLGEGPGDQHFEIRNPTVSLTAYRTGDNFGTAVSDDVKTSADPSQYVILTNNNFDEHPDMSQPDNADDTALIGTDHDLAKITLHKIDPAASDGTVSLTVSDPSSVRLFNDDGTELTGTTLDLSNPTGDLAGLLNGDVSVWVEGLKANPDLSIKIAYSDSSGDETSSDTIHMTVADWKFVDKAGDVVTQSEDVPLQYLIESSEGDPNSPVLPDNSYYKVQLNGLNADAISSISVSSDSNPDDTYSMGVVESGQRMESSDWNALYMSPSDDDVLTTHQRDDLDNTLQVDAVHNDGAKIVATTQGGDSFTRTLPAKNATVSDWQAYALAQAHIDPAQWDPTQGFMENPFNPGHGQYTIVKKVYDYYQSVYKRNNNLQWAGMARMAGMPW